MQSRAIPTTRGLTALLALGLSACAATESAYADRFGTRYCARLKACGEAAYFEAFPKGTAACQPELAEQVEDYRYGPEPEDRVAESEDFLCTFVVEQAAEALDTLEEAACSDLPRASWIERTASSAWDCVILDRAHPASRRTR